MSAENLFDDVVSALGTCSSSDQVAKVMGDLGYELSDEDLDAIVGGISFGGTEFTESGIRNNSKASSTIRRIIGE